MADNSGKWVAKAEYAAIESYEDGYYLMQKDGKWGLLRPDGKKALDCKYVHDMISAAEYIFAREAGNPGKWQAWDKICECKTSFKNVSMRQVADGFSIVSGEIGKASMLGYRKYEFQAFIEEHRQLGEEAQNIIDLRYGGNINFLLTKSGVSISGVSDVARFPRIPDWLIFPTMAKMSYIRRQIKV